MNKIKQYFTLIELIAVIVILGVLAAIIIPNISDSKKDSLTSMISSNIRILQTATDSYLLKTNQYPTVQQPTIEQPQLIDIEELYPKYLKSKPDYDKLKNQYYWVDAYGQVWGASVEGPSNIHEGSDIIEWSHNERVVGYNLYQVVDNTITGKVETKKISLLSKYNAEEYLDRVQIEKPDSQFLLSALDEYGLESAPVGLSNNPYQDGFKPLRNKEGEFLFEITSKELMYWDDFRVVEDKPAGTSIEYSFSIQNKDGEYQSYISEFENLPASKGIQVKVKMTGANGKLPSLLDMRVDYHFDKQKVDQFTPISLVNISNNRPVNTNSPMQIIEEFVLPQGQSIKEIQVGDYYSAPPVINYYYKPVGQTNYTPVGGGFSDVPAGSTIKIVKDYPAQTDFFMFPTLIEYKENISTEKLEEIKDSSSPAPVEEWETVQRMNFFAHTTDSQITDWLSVETTDNQPEGTRIVYKYAISNDGNWSDEIEKFEEVPDSKSLRVSAYLQVKKELLDTGIEPSVSKVRVYHTRGYIDVTQGLEGNVFPELTNFQASNSCSGAPASYVNDGNLNTMWNACGYSGWVQYTFVTPTKIKGVQIVNEATPSTGQTFTFRGYKNGQWYDLGSQNVYTNQKPHIHTPFMIEEDTYEVLYVHVNGGSSWAAIREILLIQ